MNPGNSETAPKGWIEQACHFVMEYWGLLAVPLLLVLVVSALFCPGRIESLIKRGGESISTRFKKYPRLSSLMVFIVGIFVIIGLIALLICFRGWIDLNRIILGGVGAIVTLLFLGWRTYNQDRQVTYQVKALEYQIKKDIKDHLNNAVKLLNDNNASVRETGAYSLYEIFVDEYGKEHQAKIVKILCSHIRAKTQDPKYQEEHKNCPSSDIQKVIDLLFKKKKEEDDSKGIYCMSEIIGWNFPPANLQGAFLCGANFREMHCVKVDFQNAHCEKADFLGANCEGSDFQDAYCEETMFANAILMNARFKSTRCMNAYFVEATCKGGNFFGALCEGADFRDAHCEGANFQGARCTNVGFYGTYCEGANFQGARCDKAYFQGAHCEGANFQGALCTDTDFRGAYCEGANFQDARCEIANFRGAHCEGADFQDVRCINAFFQGAHCEGANFQSAYCEIANFQGAHCEGAKFRGAHCEGADFQDVRCINAGFQETHCEGVNFQGVCFTNADFRDAHCEGADFSNVSVSQAKFRNANFKGSYALDALKNYDSGAERIKSQIGKDTRLENINFGGITDKGFIPEGMITGVLEDSDELQKIIQKLEDLEKKWRI